MNPDISEFSYGYALILELAGSFRLRDLYRHPNLLRLPARAVTMSDGLQRDRICPVKVAGPSGDPFPKSKAINIAMDHDRA
jgi:hypothetical protein